MLRVPVLDLTPAALDLTPAAQSAPAQSTAAAQGTAAAQSTAPPVRPQPRRAEQQAAPGAGCAATAEDKEEEGAPAGEPPPPPAEEVALAVTGSGGAPGSSLARGRLPGAMTACVDSGGALRWVRPTLSASGGALAAAVDSASQAKGLVYVSFKQARQHSARSLQRANTARATCSAPVIVCVPRMPIACAHCMCPLHVPLSCPRRVPSRRALRWPPSSAALRRAW